MKRLLLLSNSTLKGEIFLGWPEAYIEAFLGKSPCKILFFPFAGVSISFEDYYLRVRDRLGEMGYEVLGAHQVSNKKAALDACDAIAVGGGNTFQLLSYLQDGWMELIRKKVQAGMPYIGWSAGSNVACPSIKTTNDMPIIQPQNFEALNLVDFQINPHYTEATLPNHGGESRADRIGEFLIANPKVKVLGIPEGSLLQIEDEQIAFKGIGPLVYFEKGKDPVKINEGILDL